MKRALMQALMLAVSAILGAGHAGAASNSDAIPAAAYRQGLPDVLAAPSRDDEHLFDKARFKSVYAKAGRPSMLLFWNRELTDHLRQGVVTTVETGTNSQLSVSAEEVVPGMFEGTVEHARNKTTRKTTEFLPVPNQRRSPVERVDAQIRSGFVGALLASGVSLVDRNLTMRSVSMQQKDDSKLDSQVVEMNALRRYAKLIAEVTCIPDPQAASGWSMRVTVRRAADGVLLLDHYEDNGENPRPQKYSANPAGGFKAAPASQKTVGVTLAEQAMSRLAESLAR